MALLEVNNVTMAFGSLLANDNVSFTIEPGTIVGLIGPNGAGKTTLFNCISGFYQPTGGRIVFDGKDITRLPPYQVSRLGAVRTFQVVHPLKEMTVRDNVLVGAFMRHRKTAMALAVAERCIRLCHLWEERDKPAGGVDHRRKKTAGDGPCPGNGAQALHAR